MHKVFSYGYAIVRFNTFNVFWNFSKVHNKPTNNTTHIRHPIVTSLGVFVARRHTFVIQLSHLLVCSLLGVAILLFTTSEMRENKRCCRQCEDGDSQQGAIPDPADCDDSQRETAWEREVECCHAEVNNLSYDRQPVNFNRINSSSELFMSSMKCTNNINLFMDIFVSYDQSNQIILKWILSQ